MAIGSPLAAGLRSVPRPKPGMRLSPHPAFHHISNQCDWWLFLHPHYKNFISRATALTAHKGAYFLRHHLPSHGAGVGQLSLFRYSYPLYGRVRCLLWGGKLDDACNAIRRFPKTKGTDPHFPYASFRYARCPLPSQLRVAVTAACSPYLLCGTPGISPAISGLDLGRLLPTSTGFRP